MRTTFLVALSLAGLLALAACQGSPPTEETAVPTAVATVAQALSTPVSRVSTVVAGAVATPFRGLTTAGTNTFRATPSATPTPGTPTATPTPAPSASLLREAAAVQVALDAFREAVASGEKDALLKAQRELMAALPEAEAAAAQDNSKAAETFRIALRDLRAALGGDLAKLDSASKGVAAVSGGSGRTSLGTSTLSTASAAAAIASLPKFASDLADQIAGFRKAQESGNTGDLLRFQKGLLDAVDQGDAALKNARSQQALTVKGALEDLRNALGGDAVKYDAAEQKLRQIASTDGGNTANKTTTTTSAKQVDLQPIANELGNKLNAYQHAAESDNKDEMTKAKQALSDQVKKAQDSIKDDQSPKAAKLRQALTAVQEAAAGDQTKIDAAKSALEGAIAGQ